MRHSSDPTIIWTWTANIASSEALHRLVNIEGWSSYRDVLYLRPIRDR